MTRRQYLAEVIRLYLEAEETPSRASRRDWAIAGDLYRQGVPVQHLAHAMRIASLRRGFHHHPPLATVSSLAYYRAILEKLDLSMRRTVRAGELGDIDVLLIQELPGWIGAGWG